MVKKSVRRSAVAAGLMLLTACGEQAASPQPAPVLEEAKADTSPLISTAWGPVRGAVSDGILSFRGIRYGAATATTRFAAPAAPEPWQDVRDATAYGASCPQTRTGNPGGLFTSWRPDPSPPMAEDCLFLNVWTPALADGGKRALVDDKGAYGNRYQR
ncbi:MAG TPA: carboxylesterase family protein [Pseudomonadales bacterium]